MEIHTLFPLAVATRDLAPEAACTEAMRVELAPYVAAAALQRRAHRYAWTGDVNECNDLHRREAFAWLRGEVERDALAFVRALGGAARARLWFRGSWPVLADGQETVASHVHETANVSAVYYLSVPAGPGGALVFENWSRPNALASGFGEQGDPNTAGVNPLNAVEAVYPPRQGWLVVFPARQPHFVRAHGADELRIAIAFDVALADPAEPACERDPRDWFGATPEADSTTPARRGQP